MHTTRFDQTPQLYYAFERMTDAKQQGSVSNTSTGHISPTRMATTSSPLGNPRLNALDIPACLQKTQHLQDHFTVDRFDLLETTETQLIRREIKSITFNCSDSEAMSTTNQNIAVITKSQFHMLLQQCHWIFSAFISKIESETHLLLTTAQKDELNKVIITLWHLGDIAYKALTPISFGVHNSFLMRECIELNFKSPNKFRQNLDNPHINNGIFVKEIKGFTQQLGEYISLFQQVMDWSKTQMMDSSDIQMMDCSHSPKRKKRALR